MLVRDPEPLLLDDKVWSVIEPFLTRPKEHGGRPPADYRRYLEGIRWIAWTGRPWRHLPERFGKADSVRRFHSRLVRSGRWEKLLSAFPKKTTKGDDRSQAKAQAFAQLAFLRDLDDRRPRGIAVVQQEKDRAGMSPNADKLRPARAIKSPRGGAQPIL